MIHACRCCVSADQQGFGVPNLNSRTCHEPLAYRQSAWGRPASFDMPSDKHGICRQHKSYVNALADVCEVRKTKIHVELT